jgi:hypothetical protein
MHTESMLTWISPVFARGKETHRHTKKLYQKHPAAGVILSFLFIKKTFFGNFLPVETR